MPGGNGKQLSDVEQAHRHKGVTVGFSSWLSMRWFANSAQSQQQTALPRSRPTLN